MYNVKYKHAYHRDNNLEESFFVFEISLKSAR